MEPLIIALHILVCLGIVGLILLQQGKGAEMGASFGSGGSQTLFGSAGSGNMLSHATAILVTIFFSPASALPCSPSSARLQAQKPVCRPPR